MNTMEYVRMLRISDWIKFYPFIPIIGALFARASIEELIVVYAIFLCVIAYGFVVNNYYDVSIDKIHKEKIKTNKNPLVAGTVTEYNTRVLMLILVIIPLFLAALLSWMGFAFTILTILAFAFYSGAGLRLKDIIGIDVLTHGFMFGFFPFMAGFTLADGVIGGEILVVAALFTILGFEALLTHQINDFEEDRKSTITTAVKIGVKNSFIVLGMIIASSLIVLAIIALIFEPNPIVIVAAAAYLIAYPICMCRGEIFNDINFSRHPNAE